MARLKIDLSWLSVFGVFRQCGAWTASRPVAWAPKSRAQKEIEAESRLKSQLRVQEAHISEALAAITRCERDKATARATGDRAGFETSVRERRRAVLQLKRYRQLEAFSRKMLDSVTDANLVRESVETLGQVKEAFAGAGMDKLINQMQDTVGDLDDWKVRSVLQRPRLVKSAALVEKIDATRGTTSRNRISRSNHPFRRNSRVRSHCSRTHHATVSTWAT